MAERLTAAERKRISEEAVANMRAALADADLPSAAELDAMSLDELLAFLGDNGIELDLDRMFEEVRGAIGRDAVQLARGTMSPAREKSLIGRVDAAIKAQAVSVANQSMGDLRQEAILDADDREPDEQWLMWVTVNGDNACPDCQGLHGYVDLADAWEGIAPRDGNTVCGGACKCSLVPCGAPASQGERVALEPGRGLPTR